MYSPSTMTVIVFVIPTTSKLAVHDSRDVSLLTVILYSPASDLSVLMIDSEYLSASDVIDSLSLADSSVPSLYLVTRDTNISSLYSLDALFHFILFSLVYEVKFVLRPLVDLNLMTVFCCCGLEFAT